MHSLIVHMIASRGFDLVRWKVVGLPELGCLPPCTHRWLLFVTWTTQLTNCPVDPSSYRVKRSVISDFLNDYINMCWPKVMKSGAVNTANSGIGVIPSKYRDSIANTSIYTLKKAAYLGESMIYEMDHPQILNTF